MQNLLAMLGRTRPLFESDLAAAEATLTAAVADASFLVIGGAGSIGQHVVRELFMRRPRRLHVVDISENNLVELVRDLRSSLGYIPGDFRTLPLDCGSPECAAFLGDQEPYDAILNLSALKHVRSEKDPYTLMRMIRVNILNTETSLAYAAASKCGKYFAVSTDKAVNPSNAMGATKRVMELCLLRASRSVPTSTARFANVAFSDGSLLHGFVQRLSKRQPISAPRDIFRYFMTGEEAGRLCLLSAVLGANRELFFPKTGPELTLTGFPAIAELFLRAQGFEVDVCATEEEARQRIPDSVARGKWPCHFFASDTQGEKEAEEFFAAGDDVDFERFHDIGVIRTPLPGDFCGLEEFLRAVRNLSESGSWEKDALLDSLRRAVPEFRHRAAGRSLDERM